MVKIYEPYSSDQANRVLNVPDDYANIQQAINAPDDGDAILVANGI